MFLSCKNFVNPSSSTWTNGTRSEWEVMFRLVHYTSNGFISSSWPAMWGKQENACRMEGSGLYFPFFPFFPRLLQTAPYSGHRSISQMDTDNWQTAKMFTKYKGQTVMFLSPALAIESLCICSLWLHSCVMSTFWIYLDPTEKCIKQS